MGKRENKAVTKTQRIQGPMPSPRLLPLKQAAQYLGLTVWAIRERIWAGQIPVVQFPGGRKQYIDVKDLEDLIKNNKIRIT
ncbi:MAG: helix-turn-helix domain-containing protein [Desulfobacterales bacterium]|mgnify:CR=1 FL=1|jgi:predicted site-specific integrase-resolvase